MQSPIKFITSGLGFGRLYLADHGSTDHGSADHVICMLNSILSTGKYLYPILYNYNN